MSEQPGSPWFDGAQAYEEYQSDLAAAYARITELEGKLRLQEDLTDEDDPLFHVDTAETAIERIEELEDKLNTLKSWILENRLKNRLLYQYPELTDWLEKTV